MTPETIAFLTECSEKAYGEIPENFTPIIDGQMKPRGFFLAGKDAGLVSFKGSKSPLDWLIDFDITQEPYFDIGYVHQGFLFEFRKVWPQISAEFHEHGPGYPVRVTGHSLGGALATLAAHAFSRRGFDVELVTLGSPRVGDFGFVQAFNRAKIDSVRIQYHDDLVPRVPKLGYGHVDKLLRIGDDGREIWFSGIRGTVERWFEVAKADLEGSAETDHKIEKYVNAVKNWVERKRS